MSSSSSSSPACSQQEGNAQIRTEKQSISEIIAETFPPFDHRTAVVEPFDNESKRDAEFLEKLNVMLLELVLEFHAWSTARPMHESDRTADVLEKEVKAVVELEKEQEKTRQRLNDFVTRIKLALAALTGISG